MFIKKDFWTLFLFMAIVLAIIFVLPLTISAAGAETTYTVTFDSQGGSAVAGELSQDDGTIAFPAVPIKCVQDSRRYFDDWYLSETYYYFEGWYTSTDYTTPWNFSNTVTQDMTLYAKWSTGPCQTYAAYSYGDFTFSLINNNMEAVIDGYYGLGGDLVIPDSVLDPNSGRQIPVVRLCWAWFAYPPPNNMDKITSVMVPDSVREIDYFFDATPSNSFALTDVYLGSGVKAIDYRAFYRMSALKSINLPQGLVYIGDLSFCGCTSLEHIDIPNTVTHIGSDAFDGCGFTNIVIPDSVTTLGSGTFERTRLTGITLGNGLLEIPYGCFWDVPDLTGVVIPDSVSRIGMSAFGEDRSLSYMQIGNNVTTVGDGVFTDTAIKTVIFGRSISAFPVNIGDSAHFYNVHFIMMGDAPTQPGFLSAYSGQAFYCAKEAAGYDAPGWENVSALFRYDPAALDWYMPALVRFDLNGAEGAAPYDQDLYKGVYVNKPAIPTRDGYSFGGWYTEASCQNAWNFNDPVAGDMTLYAKWLEGSSTGISCTPDKTIVKVGETTDITLTVKDSTGTALPDKLVDIEGAGVYLQGTTDSSGAVSFTLTPKYEEAFRIWIDNVEYQGVVFALWNDSGVLQVSATGNVDVPYNSIYLEIQNDKGRWERWNFSGNTIRMPAPAGDYEVIVVCPGNDAMDGLYVVKTMTVTAGQVTNNDVDWNGTVAANMTYTYGGNPISNGEIQLAKAVAEGKESHWGRPVGYYGTLSNRAVHVTPGTYSVAAIGGNEALEKLFLTQNGLAIDADGSFGNNWNPGDTQTVNFNISGTFSNNFVNRSAVIDKSYVDISSGALRINVGEHTVNHIKGSVLSAGNENYLFEKKDDILIVTAEGEACYDLNIDQGTVTLETDTPSVLPGNGVHLGVVLTTVSGHTLGSVNGNFDNNAHITVTNPESNLVWDGYQYFRDFWYNVDGNAKAGTYTVHATGNLGGLYGNYDVTTTFDVTGGPEVKVTDLIGNPLMLIPTRQDNDVRITLTAGGQPLSSRRVYMDGMGRHYEGDTDGNGEVVFSVNVENSGNFNIGFDGNNYDNIFFAGNEGEGVLEVSAFGNEGNPYDNIDLEIWGDKGGWGRGNGGNTVRVLAPAGEYEAVVACPGNDGMDGLYVVKTMTVTAGQVTHEDINWAGTVAANLTYTYNGQSITNSEILFAKAGTEGKDSRWGRWLGSYSTLDNRTIRVTPGTYNLAITGENGAGEKLFLPQNGLAINNDGNFGCNWNANGTQILNLKLSGVPMDNVNKWITIDKFNMYINWSTIRINLGEHTINGIDIKGDTPEGTVQYRYEKAGDILNITSDSAADYYLDTAQTGDITLNMDTASVSPGNSVHLGVSLITASGHKLVDVWGNFDNSAHITITGPNNNLVWDSYTNFRDFWYNVDWNATPGEYTVHATGNLGWLYGSYGLTTKFTVMGKPEVKITDMDGNPLMLVPTGRDTDVRITLAADGQPLSGVFVSLNGPAGLFEGYTNENGEVVFTVNPGGNGSFYLSFNGNTYDSLLFAVNEGDGILEVSAYDDRGTPYGNIDLEIFGDKGGWGSGTGGNTVMIIAPAGEYEAVVACGGNDGMDGLYVVKNMTVTAGQVTLETVDWTDTVAANLTYTFDGKPIINGEIQFAKEGTDGKYSRWGRWLGGFSNLSNRVVHVTPGTYYLAAVGWNEANEKLFLTQNGLAINADDNYGHAWSAGETQILNLNISSAPMADATISAAIDKLYVDIGTGKMRINLGEHIISYTEVKGDKPEGFVCYRYEKPGDTLNITSDGASDYYLDIAQAGDITLNVDTPSVSPGNGVHLGVSLTTASGHKLLDAWGNFDSSAYVTVTDPEGNPVWEGYQYFRDFWYNADWNAKPGEYTVRATGNLGRLYGDYDVTAIFTVAGRMDVKVTDMDGSPLMMIPTRQDTDIRFTLTTDDQPVSNVRVNLDGPAGHFEGNTNENGEVSFTVNPAGSGNFFININGYNYDDQLFAVENNQGLVEISAKDINGYPLENFEAAISGNGSMWSTLANGPIARLLATEGQNLVRIAQKAGNGKEAYYIIKDIYVNASEVNQAEITPEGTVAETISFTYDDNPLTDGNVVLEIQDMAYQGAVAETISFASSINPLQTGEVVQQNQDSIFKVFVSDLGFDNTVGGINVYATPGTYKASVNKIIQSDGDNALLYQTMNDLPFTEAGPREYSCEWGSSNTGKLHVDVTAPGEYKEVTLVLNDSSLNLANTNDLILSAGNYTVNRIFVSNWNDSGWYEYGYLKTPGAEDTITIDPAADASLNIDLGLKSASIARDNDKEKLQPGDIVNFTMNFETNSGYMLFSSAGIINTEMIAEITNPDGTSEVNYLNYNWMRLEIPEGKQNGIYTLNLKANLSPFYPLVEATTTFEIESVMLTAAIDETFAEGSEDGKLITVTLGSGVFNTDMDVEKVILTGLPEGVLMGAVTRTSDATITIVLSGNSTVDYDDDITVGISIGKDQVAPAQFADLTGSVALKATVEPQPAAPEITFSFDGKHAGRLVGIQADTMEYSLTGDDGYKTATHNNLKLSDEEIASITDTADIRIRVKEDFRIPAGAPMIIDILPGPGAPPVTGDDAADTVDGLSKDTEFSKDGGISWTGYQNQHDLGDLSGTFTLMVRRSATGTTMAGAAAALNFTAANPPLTLTAEIAPFNEGSEDGKTIKVKLANGEFINKLDAGQVTLSGLPEGVNQGKVKKQNDLTITIELSGNSIVDYDVDIPVTVIIGKDQVTPAQTEDLTGIVILTATVEPQPAAPERVSFSFDGRNAGKLMRTTTAMEFSLDGGNTYIPVTKNNQKLSPEEIAAISTESDILVRVRETLRAPAGDAAIIDILSREAPAVSTLEEITKDMEYSIDSGFTWMKYDKKDLWKLAGITQIMVRYFATENIMASDPVTLDTPVA